MSFSLFNRNKDSEVTENNNSEVQQEKKGRRFPTQTVLLIRAIVGGYLIYTAYELYTDKSGGVKNWVMWFFTIFFAIVGAVIIAHSGYLYYKGEYEGGKADVEEEEADEESETIEKVEAVEESETIEMSETVESSVQAEAEESPEDLETSPEEILS